MRPASVRGGAGLVLLVDAAMLVLATVLGMHFEATARALADAEKGQSVATPAVASGVLALVAMIGARRRWAPLPLALAAVLAIVSVVLYAVR